MEKQNLYYDVALGSNPKWDKHEYTYSHDGDIAPFTLVVVPFGTSKKVGYVIRKSKKPKFKTREITSVLQISLPLNSQKLLSWLHEYYPGDLGAHIQHFVPAFLSTKLPEYKESIETKAVDIENNLTDLQKKVFAKLKHDKKPNILHGITGSGKTHVYMAAINDQIQNGKNALLLYPEISLSTQLEKSLVSTFGVDIVHVYHSKRTVTQQKKTWINALNSTGGHIFIGPRSALFLPMLNLGIIIIDEAHDGSYKQDSGIRYNGIIIAAKLAKLHDAKLILGSATPPVSETQQILQKGGSIVTMDKLALSEINNIPPKPHPSTSDVAEGSTFRKGLVLDGNSEKSVRNFEIVDMRERKNHIGNTNLLTKQLLKMIQTSLHHKKQSLLFINRKGTARMLMCEDCGWHAECSQCEMPLVYHHDTHRIQCTICGRNYPSIHLCPKCGGNILQKSHGIKAVEQELRSHFPNAKISRFDGDTHKSETMQENYESIRGGEVDILIGTQILTKGLDLPHLETVGILQAENALNLPDYSSEERTFQQLVQVSGRVGRGHNHKANIVIQTYDPSNELFEFIKNSNWPKFYERELAQRKIHQFPPYSYLLKVWTAESKIEKAESNCRKLLESLDTNHIKVMGPAPSFYQKKAGKFYWQIIFIAKSRKKLSDIASTLPKEFNYDLDPISLL